MSELEEMGDVLAIAATGEGLLRRGDHGAVVGQSDADAFVTDVETHQTHSYIKVKESIDFRRKNGQTAMIRIGVGELAIQSHGAALRTALALSCATRAPFRWEGFRQKAPTPGFRTADAESVRLFAELTRARCVGGSKGDDSLEFEPAGARSGPHRFEVDPGGSMGPILRAAVLPLALAAADGELVLSGSTHAPGGDTYELTSSTFAYLLRELGADVTFELGCAGFAPRGGGEVTIRHRRAGSAWKALELVELDELESIQILSGGASLPAHVQQRQAARARSGVHVSGVEPTVQLVKLRARSGGSVVAVTGLFGEVPITVASVSQRGKSAESVGEQAAASFRRFANQKGVVPGALVDSLLVLLAFADGVSRFTTPRLPVAIQGQARLVRAFTGRDVAVEGKAGSRGLVRVEEKAVANVT